MLLEEYNAYDGDVFVGLDCCRQVEQHNRLTVLLTFFIAKWKVQINQSCSRCMNQAVQNTNTSSLSLKLKKRDCRT